MAGLERALAPPSVQRSVCRKASTHPHAEIVSFSTRCLLVAASFCATPRTAVTIWIFFIFFPLACVGASSLYVLLHTYEGTRFVDLILSTTYLEERTTINTQKTNTWLTRALRSSHRLGFFLDGGASQGPWAQVDQQTRGCSTVTQHGPQLPATYVCIASRPKYTVPGLVQVLRHRTDRLLTETCHLPPYGKKKRRLYLPGIHTPFPQPGTIHVTLP